MNRAKLQPNVILVDADYVDSVAYDLTENFEQMLFRSLPKADLAEWLVCAALDGGVPEGKNTVQVIFVHTPEKVEMANFTPGLLDKELDGLAFHDDTLGEFLMSAVEDRGNIMYDKPLMEECVSVVLQAPEVERLIVVPEMDASGEALLKTLAEAHKGKHVTLLTMRPPTGTGFSHVMLGYSIMHALGIKSNEI